MAEVEARAYGERPHWAPGRPRIRPRRLLLQWVTSALALYIAAILVPGVKIEGLFGAFIAAALIAVLNAVLPPLIAALRLPYMLAVGFLLVLVLDAWMVLVAADLSDNTFKVDGFLTALFVSLVAAAVTVVLEVLLGTNDDDVYSLRVTQRIARRSRARVVTDVPGIIYLEIDGLARPVLQRAVRDGHAPEMARWLAERHAPALRVGDRPLVADRRLPVRAAARLQRRHPRLPLGGEGVGPHHDLLGAGGLRPHRGAALHRPRAAGRRRRQPQQPALRRRRPGDPHREPDGGRRRRPIPGYRAYLADGYNVTRTFVLFFYEVVLELSAAARQRRRDVRPRGHRSVSYAFMRAGLSVFVRDFTVHSIISDMMMGVPAVYACFAGYDEVAHHSGLERSDALEVLRKLDQQFGRIARARQYAARPYEIVVLSDHGQTQGADLPAAQRVRPRRAGGAATCGTPASSTWRPATRTTRPSPRPCARPPAASRRTSTSTRSATARWW